MANAPPPTFMCTSTYVCGLLTCFPCLSDSSSSIATSVPNDPQGKPVAVPDCGLAAKWPVAGLVDELLQGQDRAILCSQVRDLLNWRLLSRRTRSPKARYSPIPARVAFLETLAACLSGLDRARGRDGQPRQARKGSTSSSFNINRPSVFALGKHSAPLQKLCCAGQKAFPPLWKRWT